MTRPYRKVDTQDLCERYVFARLFNLKAEAVLAEELRLRHRDPYAEWSLWLATRHREKVAS